MALGCCFVHWLYQESQDKSKLSMYNIEALSDDDEYYHVWCCGSTDKCAYGPHYEIVGKLTYKPCE